MKIVIDIPEGIMEYVTNNGCLSVYDEEVTEAIINGTPYEDRPQGEYLKVDSHKAYWDHVGQDCDFEEQKGGKE